MSNIHSTLGSFPELSIALAPWSQTNHLILSTESLIILDEINVIFLWNKILNTSLSYFLLSFVKYFFSSELIIDNIKNTMLLFQGSKRGL